MKNKILLILLILTVLIFAGYFLVSKFVVSNTVGTSPDIKDSILNLDYLNVILVFR